MNQKVRDIEEKLQEIDLLLSGDRTKRRLDIDQPPTPGSRIGSIMYEQKYSTAAPTKTHIESYAIAKEEYYPIKQMVDEIYENDIKALEKMLKDNGAPYTPGRLKNKN